jgi:hypothetical protein
MCRCPMLGLEGALDPREHLRHNPTRLVGYNETDAYFARAARARAPVVQDPKEVFTHVRCQ